MKINSRQVVSFLGGLFFTAIPYAALLFIYVIATFSLAGETLTEKENRDTFCFFVMLGIVGLTAFIIYGRLKNKQPYTVIGMIIPFLLALYGLITTSITWVDNITYHYSFDQHEWKRNDSAPFRMAKTLTKKKLLIGKTTQQVIADLGEGDFSCCERGSIERIFYTTDRWNWELRIYFENNKVTKAFLYEEGF